MNYFYWEMLGYAFLTSSVVGAYYSLRLAKHKYSLRALQLAGIGFITIAISSLISLSVKWYIGIVSKNAVDELYSTLGNIGTIASGVSLTLQTSGFVLVALSMYKLGVSFISKTGSKTGPE